MRLQGLPILGAGLGYHKEFRQDLSADTSGLDYLELMADHYLEPLTAAREEELEEMCALGLPITAHAIDLSIGADEAIDPEYLQQLGKFCERAGAHWFSEHLSFTRAGGIEIGQLTGLPFTEESIDTVCRHVNALRDFVRVPILLENAAYYFPYAHSELSEPEFITEILTRADVGLLLDVANLYINSTNHRYDPFEFIDRIPPARVVQLHIAGGMENNGVLIDSHSDTVPGPTWELARYAAERCDLKAIMLERDMNVPPFGEIVAELGRARELMATVQRRTALASPE